MWVFPWRIGQVLVFSAARIFSVSKGYAIVRSIAGGRVASEAFCAAEKDGIRNANIRRVRDFIFFSSFASAFYAFRFVTNRGEWRSGQPSVLCPLYQFPQFPWRP